MVDKETLLERIRTSRRQLERYLFYFEKDKEGGFVASKRPKFGEEEMAQPGVAGDWTVCDLLAHLIDREERLLPWLGAAGENKTPDTQQGFSVIMGAGQQFAGLSVELPTGGGQVCQP
jgi:hypothetical protein